MTFVVPTNSINLDQHECPAALLKCVDFRFRQSDQEFVEKELGFADFDLYSWPGSGKEILNNNGFKKSFVEKIIQVSCGLHKAKKLILLWHYDCGGYGGTKSFENPQAEEERYQADARKARDLLKPELSDDLEIILAYSKMTPQGLEYVVID